MKLKLNWPCDPNVDVNKPALRRCVRVRLAQGGDFHAGQEFGDETQVIYPSGRNVYISNSKSFFMYAELVTYLNFGSER